MDISLRLDTLGIVEVNYLRTRERYRDWPHFQLLAASRQARVMSYFTREVAEQLHQQVVMIESALGLDFQDQDNELQLVAEQEEKTISGDDGEHEHGNEVKASERGDSSSFSPAFAQALKQLNELARQRLPEAGSTGSGSNQVSGELTDDTDSDDDALEQLQDAFVQMMEVVRELAEEMATDALKLTTRFKCARTNIEFIPRTDDDDDDDDDESDLSLDDDQMLDLEVELVMVLQLFEEGRTKPEDLPAVELQLDVEDFERLHETLDLALERERRSRRKR